MASQVLNTSAMNLSSVELLSGTNFKKWKVDIQIVLGLMDLDLAIREDEPAALTEESTASERAKHAKWEKSNRMALLIMKRLMTETVRGGIPDSDKAKDFFIAVGDKYKESDKAETGNLMNSLTTMKYDGNGSVREYIMKLIDIASKLKALDVPISDAFLVHVALNSLPTQFGQLKVSYNTQRDKWEVNELISICVQEEERIKFEKNETVNFVHSGHAKKKSFQNGMFPNASKGSHATKNATPFKGSQNLKPTKTTVFKCYFCKKGGHMKKNCEKYKAWLVKKGINKQEGTK